jgi:hypothetical protein
MIPCGIAIPQTFERSPIDVRLIREFVPKAETLGYESLWVQEQIITDALILEPVTLLTYAAALSSKASRHLGPAAGNSKSCPTGQEPRLARSIEPRPADRRCRNRRAARARTCFRCAK